MKNKFAGFLRGLLRHADDRETGRPLAAAPANQPEAPAPAYAPAAPAEAMTEGFDSTSQPATVNTNEILLPLAAVIAHLPMDLKAKLMAPPAAGQTIALAVDKVTSQLAFGSVKIPFGELRRLAPGIFANSGGEFDAKPVSLPLAEILSRLNPALLSRKPVQKVDVAEDISGPFDGRGQGITFTTQPLKPLKPATVSPATAELNRMSQPVAFNPPPITARPVVPPRTITPAPAQSGDTEVFSFKARQTAPASTPIPFNPNPPTPSSNGNGNGNGHSNGHTNGNGNGNGNGALPPFKFATAPAPSAPVSSSTPRPEPAQPRLSQPALLVSLDDLAENWPAPLKQLIVTSSFASTNVPLPMNLVESGLKRGRVTATWKEIRTWIKPSSPASPHDELSLDLPLKVLAPAFLSAQKETVKLRSKLAVDEEIPNLFFGFPQPSAESAHPVPAPAPAPAPVFTPAQHLSMAPAPAPVAPAAPAAPAARAADTNFFTSNDIEETPFRRPNAPATDFVNRHAHPQEVVARAMALHGVAGAVVALADGLRVASQVPADMNADAMAAFLPQIFERVNQTTRELRMGTLNNVGFTVGNVPWKIFRINSIYFAAFGRAGEALPKSQLAGLAAELDRKKQF
ncbi:MAG TPA: hypothetical protein VK815_15820 [Candidatus Acidoferrales bacterium]|nr:hypothetical protein [Candidatus Acidoferrales bacterium]